MTDLPPARLWADRLRHWADVQPDAHCVTYQDQRYTWAEWYERVRRVAGGLAALGVRRGDRVASIDMNNLSTVETTNAAALLGAAHVIVNFRLFGDQLAYVLADSAPRVVLVGAEFADGLAAVRDRLPSIERVIVVGGDADEYQAWVDGSEPADQAPDVEPTDTVIVMYSSGTTGHPKGVELTHAGMNAHSEHNNAYFRFAPGVTSLAAMPLFHVGGTSYVQIGMHWGASTVMLREVAPAAMFRAIAEGADRLFLVPAVVAGVLDGGDAAIAAFGGLRCFCYGASPMPLPLLRRALGTWPDVEFSQVYGMTEFGGVVTTLSPEAHRDPDHPERLTSAGRPVEGVEVRVVDPVTLRDVEPGSTGELWFRTDQTMKGYLGKPEATAETITADGWLRTGDLGRVDSGGFVFVLDRLKDMIVTGGENVYSPEVENVLAAHPQVAEVAVFGIPHPQWVETVHAVVVPRPGETLDPDEVIAFARERLAHFKCPTTVEVVAALPRNPSGKILKRDLRAPHWAGRESAIS
ncbi:MAG: long-chain-fatty-acid--CoA ligase [Frankiales bacterium]|nr:long-chain-fatty-acid--CoA ligase [Frankiales bacterium]